MDSPSKDTDFNYKIIIAALIAIILAMLIAFYYAYSQYNAQVENLNYERELLMKDMTYMDTQIANLNGANEVAEIRLQKSKTQIQQLQDSVGKLNFSLTQLREDRKALIRLEKKYDELLARTNEVLENNQVLSRKYDQARRELNTLRGNADAITSAEAEARRKSLMEAEANKTKTYLTIINSYGSAQRSINARTGNTNKASVTEYLRGCVQVEGMENASGNMRVLYLQFLDPDLKVIEDNNRVVNVAGNVYSKKMQLAYIGDAIEVCESITVMAGSLNSGIYTLNVFEGERLLSSSEFQLQ